MGPGTQSANHSARLPTASTAPRAVHEKRWNMSTLHSRNSLSVIRYAVVPGHGSACGAIHGRGRRAVRWKVLRGDAPDCSWWSVTVAVKVTKFSSRALPTNGAATTQLRTVRTAGVPSSRRMTSLPARLKTRATFTFALPPAAPDGTLNRKSKPGTLRFALPTPAAPSSCGRNAPQELALSDRSGRPRAPSSSTRVAFPVTM